MLNPQSLTLTTSLLTLRPLSTGKYPECLLTLNQSHVSTLILSANERPVLPVLAVRLLVVADKAHDDEGEAEEDSEDDEDDGGGAHVLHNIPPGSIIIYDLQVG